MHRRAHTAAIQLLDGLYCGVEVTTVTQVNLNLIRVAFDELFGDASTRLKKIQTRANLVGGKRLAGFGRDLDAHVADLDLTLYDETQSDRTSARCSFFDNLDARIRNPPGIEQRL